MGRNLFGAGKHIEISMHENRRNYYGCLAGIMQKAGFVKRESLVKILLHCLFLKLTYGTCYTFSVKSNLSLLKVTLMMDLEKFLILLDIQV